MNNNIYHWQDEYMAELKDREIRSELEHIRLLKEAGLYATGGLFHAVKAISNRLAEKMKEIHDHQVLAHQLHRRRSHKFVR